MFYISKIQCYILLSCCALFECVTDIPCARMEATAGYVCVCNETYCDTIHRPHPKKGTFIQYMTSKESPGFTKSVGKFLNYGVSEDASNNASSDIHVTVNGHVEYQKIDGLGASMTESSGVTINSLGPGAKSSFFESCFGPTGVEYTFLRVPVAASDFSTTKYTYDDVPGDVDLNNFSLNEVDYKIKIPNIKIAQNISKRGLKLLGTPWTAPSWMKTNNGTTAGYLLSRYTTVWANYLYKFLESYDSEGVGFWGLTQGNEVILPVLFGSHFPIANTILLPNQARDLAKIFGSMIKQSKFKDLKIFMLDDERPFMTWYSDRIFADTEAAQYVDGIGLHWYFDTASSYARLQQFHDSYPDKDILYTESSVQGFQAGTGSVRLGDWSRGVRYIESILKNFNSWVKGFVDWNIALNTDGGPTGPTGMTLEAQIIINMTNGEFYKQPIHYCIGHFSKFIQIGAIKINTTITQPNTTEVYEEKVSMEELINILKGKLSRFSSKESVECAHNDDSLSDAFFSVHMGDTPPGTSPTGGPTSPSGGPTPPTRGPNPSSPTSQPMPPIPTFAPPSDKVTALAANNPDRTRTLIVHNPRSEPLNMTVTDAQLGTFQATLEPNSINSFCYK